MNTRTFSGSVAIAAVLATFLVVGSAAAQTVQIPSSGTNVSVTPVTTSFSPGAGQNLGTITVVGSQTGGSAISIPVTITAGGSGSLANLGNCQIFNASGASLTSSNAVSLVSGANTFTFNAPLAVNSTGMNLTVRCDVASNTPSGSTFTLAASNPALTSALNVNLDTAPTVPRGSSNVALANISLGGMNSGGTVSISSIPLSITGASGGSVANLANCKLRDPQNLTSTLTGSMTLSSGGVTTFTFSAPYMVFANTAATLALACDVQPAAAIGSTFTISIDPAQVVATNAATGARITPSAAVGTGSNGNPASLSGTVIVTDSMGTGTGTGTGTSTGTPGIPNTGLGGNVALSFLALALAGIIALAASMYLRRSLR